MTNQRSDAIQNKEKILRIARELFNATSVNEVSMKQIAVASEIGQGTLYRHYKNKADICRALMDEAIDQMFDDIQDVQFSDISEEEKIRHILHIFVRLISENRDKLEEMKTEGSKRKVMMELHFYGQLKAELLKCVEALKIVKDPEFLVDIMLNTFSKDVFEYHCTKKAIPVETFADRIHYIFIERLLGRNITPNTESGGNKHD